MTFDTSLLSKAKILTVYAIINYYHHYCNKFYNININEIEKLKELLRKRICCIPVLHYKLLIKTFLILHAEVVLKAIYNTKGLLK